MRLLCSWDFPGKNTGVGCHIFSRGYSPPRDETWVSCIAGGFFTNWATREAQSWGIYIKNWNQDLEELLALPHSLQKYWQQPKCGYNLNVYEWMKMNKENVVSMYMYLCVYICICVCVYVYSEMSVLRNSVTTWMNLGIMSRGKKKQSQKDKSCMIPLILEI